MGLLGVMVAFGANCGAAHTSGTGGGGTGRGTGGGLLITGFGEDNGGGLLGNVTAPPDSAFVAGDNGAYALGGAVTGNETSTGVVDDGNGCSTLVGVVRDFQAHNVPGGHPDFEAFSGGGPTVGLVASLLLRDSLPVYTGICEASLTGTCPYNQQTTTKSNFDQWYRSVTNVNKPYLVYLKFVPNGGVSTFESHLFFPLDNAGWGNSGTGEDKKEHNFGFTTELHTKFKYDGGETFSFTGDDDLWVFINKKLAIDLGGLHSASSASVDLDKMASTLGIAPGGVYELELFHAERHTVASNFRVDTNLSFVNCGTILPPPPA